MWTTIVYSAILLNVFVNFLSQSTIWPYLTKYKGITIKPPRDTSVGVDDAVTGELTQGIKNGVRGCIEQTDRKLKIEALNGKSREITKKVRR